VRTGEKGKRKTGCGNGPRHRAQIILTCLLSGGKTVKSGEADKKTDGGGLRERKTFSTKTRPAMINRIHNDGKGGGTARQMVGKWGEGAVDPKKGQKRKKGHVSRDREGENASGYLLSIKSAQDEVCASG